MFLNVMRLRFFLVFRDLLSLGHKSLEANKSQDLKQPFSFLYIDWMIL